MDEGYKPTVADVEVNALFVMSQAMGLLIRDAERRLAEAKMGTLKHEMKQTFTRFRQSCESACILADRLDQPIVRVSAKSGYKDYDIWQEEANELVRLVLLYADKCGQYPERVGDVFSMLKAWDGAGVIDDSVLKRFELR